MIEQADVIVIGAGGLGAATAFYLVKRGARNVVPVERRFYLTRPPHGC